MRPGPEERGDQLTKLTLHIGKELQLECAGDLGERNAGMLIFVDDRQRPEYVPWTNVEQVALDRPPACTRRSAGARSRALIFRGRGSERITRATRRLSQIVLVP